MSTLLQQLTIFNKITLGIVIHFDNIYDKSQYISCIISISHAVMAISKNNNLSCVNEYQEYIIVTYSYKTHALYGYVNVYANSKTLCK